MSRLPVSSAVPAHIAECISDPVGTYRGEPSQEEISAKVAEIIDKGKYEPGDLMDLSDCCDEAKQLARFAKLRFVMSEAIHRQKPSDYETLGRVAAEMCRDTFYDEAVEQL